MKNKYLNKITNKLLKKQEQNEKLKEKNINLKDIFDACNISGSEPGGVPKNDR